MMRTMFRLMGWRGYALAGALLIGVVASDTVSADAIPEYVKRWEFSLNADEDEGPRYSADLIFPFYRPADHRLVFVEPRVNFADREYLFNLGVGYRQLLKDREWLVGANMFYDLQTMHSHYRLGWGLEALSSYAELRGNYYLGLSQERLTEEVGGVNTFEEAVDGLDLEAGFPVPYYSRLKVFGGFNWYNFKNFDNRYGWTLRTEYTPFPFLVVDGTLSNDTKTNLDWGMTFALRIPWGSNVEDIRSPVRLDETAFPESDAGEFLYSLVERHHEIVVEKRRENNGISVEVLRGT